MLCRVCALWLCSLPAALPQLQVLQRDPTDGHAHQGSLERLGSGADLHYRLPRAVLRHRAVVPRDLRPEAGGVQHHRLVPQHGTQQQLCLPICRKRRIDLAACTGDAAVRWRFWQAALFAPLALLRRIDLSDPALCLTDFDQIYQIRTSRRHLCLCITRP